MPAAEESEDEKRPKQDEKDYHENVFRKRHLYEPRRDPAHEQDEVPHMGLGGDAP